MLGLLPLLVLPVQPAWAQPVRGPRQPPAVVVPEAGRATDVLVIKLREGAGLEVMGDRLSAGEEHPHASTLAELLVGSGPLFDREPAQLRRERSQVDPEGRLADLTLYRRLEGADVLDRARRLRTHPLVENVYLAPLPAPPPRTRLRRPPTSRASRSTWTPPPAASGSA